MKTIFALLFAAMFLNVVVLPAQQQPAAPPPPATDTVAPGIAGVVESGAVVKVLGEGFQGTEGPIALPDGSLIFTETNANRITKIGPDGKTSSFLENSNGSNGLAFDAQGRLISVQTTPGKTMIGVIYPKGREAVLSDNYIGKPYGRPNDLVVAKNGGVYFTEPGANVPAGQAPPPTSGPNAVLPPAVYYIPPGGKSIQIATGIERPNGIQLSPDERVLYVNDSRGEYLLAFDIQPDGTVRNRRNFAKYETITRSDAGIITSGADGLAVDSAGRVYTTSSTGLTVFSPQGQVLGNIPVSRPPQNMAFAGPGKKTLYIVGRGAAWRINMLAQGHQGRAK